jgi:hypothetical protein
LFSDQELIVMIAALPYPYTRRFFETEEVIISSCNYCLSPVAESGHEAELKAREEQHSCSQKVGSPTYHQARTNSK